ncbi:MAG: hypothetical protein COA58_15885 [Bacteroidetes bacterium]|nr:MAG: hypothetical protein COA58_15885 [Bacteroidota bacterium]
MKKIIIISLFILSGIGSLYLIDPAFEHKLSFENYAIKYDWRIFDNSYCNFKTGGHCFTNKTNKTNAEIELYRQLVVNYNGEEKIEQMLKEVVNKTYRFDMAYSELTKTRNVEIDSLKKYKELVFRKIMLK